MKPTLTDAKFYGERKLKTKHQTSIDACINSHVKSKSPTIRQCCILNTVSLLKIQRRNKERNPRSEPSLTEYLEQLTYSGDKNRAALCRKWLDKINRNKV